MMHLIGSGLRRGLRPWRSGACLTLAFLMSAMGADEVIFRDEFRGGLAEGWSWRREHRDAWRVGDGGLEIRVEPGNMWGPANDAKNVLVRAAPDASGGAVAISVRVDLNPTGQYEQADLVWYYDESDMVKIGHELVDGSLSVVMGREEHDQTHTIAIIPFPSPAVELRQIVRGIPFAGNTALLAALSGTKPVHAICPATASRA